MEIIEVKNTLPSPIPYVGMGVTIGIGSDCYPGTIIEVSQNHKKIIIQHDYAEPEPGDNFNWFSNQVYNITPNQAGIKETWTYRKRGVWVRFRMPKSVGYLSLNQRSKYSDPSF